LPYYSDIEHLLRRTEFVARPWRVVELANKPSLDAAVDDILAVPADPGTMSFASDHNWVRGEEYTYYWFDRMARDSPRPMQEKMAMFWHGHFCTSLKKIELMEPLRQQLDLFRRSGLGNLRNLAITMSVQPAMLRYLDNDQNVKSSPNQNFARELMELFLLGVGNYTEADVEAGTAAWTGHSDIWQTGEYVWRPETHDANAKQFLGRTINSGADWTRHGPETIEVILGNGVVPNAATVVANRNRPTREVAAEFMSRKLWRFFAGTEPSNAVVAALRDVAIANDFEIRPWVRALLLRPEFYSTEVRQGLVRSPVDLMVAYLFATGLRARNVVPLWWLEGMGQRPLVPPDVSGWKHNEYFVNAGAMGHRALAARYFFWTSIASFYAGDGLMHLGAGAMSVGEVEAMADQPEHFVDELLSRMFVNNASSTTKQVLYAHARATPWPERPQMLALALLSPEVNLA
jgi:uncharacterized protein (DUF1800 family)